MPAVLSNWRQAPGTEETTKNYRGRGVDADTDRRVCLSSLAPRAIKGLQWLYHVVRTRYISWRFRRFGPRPISLFPTAVLDQFLLLRHACYLRTGRQDTGPGILIYTPWCIPLGHDCVYTAAHAVVLPYGELLQTWGRQELKQSPKHSTNTKQRLRGTVPYTLPPEIKCDDLPRQRITFMPDDTRPHIHS